MPPRKAPGKSKAKPASATKVPWEWAFLLPWFRELKGLVMAADEERVDTSPLDIGRDPETDWWLQVAWNRELPIMSSKRVALLKKRREALLLTSVLANVDYDAWLKYLQESSGFEAPWFMDLGSKRLCPNFRFEFDSDDDADDAEYVYYDDHDADSGNDTAAAPFRNSVEWEWCTGHLLGTESFSTKFLKDYKLAMHLAKKKIGVTRKTSHAPRVQLVVRASLRNPDDQDFLEHLDYTLNCMQAARPPPGKPGFILDSITLDMKQLGALMGTIPILQRIVEMNVPICELDLPCHDTTYDHEPDWGDPTWPTVWPSFLRALCGISAKRSLRTATISTLCVPPVSNTESADAVALCSALLDSRTVKHVQLVARTVDALTMIGQDEVDNIVIPPSVWSWLALALFSSQSTTSVESLTLKGFSLHDDQVSAVEEVVQAQCPLGMMLRKLKPDVDSTTPPSLARIRIPRGTKLTAISDTTSPSFKTPAELDGLTLADDTESDDARCVFIAGYGFMLVSKPARPAKKARQQTTDSYTREESHANSSFKAFKIKSTRGDTTSQTALPRLLEIIGESLSSVRVKIPNVDEATADRMLRACPNLTHLTLANTTLSSMQIIEALFARATPLSSLALKQCRVPSADLEAFLSQLRDEHSQVYTSLQRIRIGKRWPTAFPPSTVAIFDGIVEGNSRLEHFAYYASYIKDSDEAFMDTYHGADVARIGTPLEPAARFAFFGGVSAVATKNPRLALNDHVKATILEFAANRQRREVICWEDALMGGGNPLMRFHQW